MADVDHKPEPRAFAQKDDRAGFRREHARGEARVRRPDLLDVASDFSIGNGEHRIFTGMRQIEIKPVGVRKVRLSVLAVPVSGGDAGKPVRPERVQQKSFGAQRLQPVLPKPIPVDLRFSFD